MTRHDPAEARPVQAWGRTDNHTAQGYNSHATELAEMFAAESYVTPAPTVEQGRAAMRSAIGECRDKVAAGRLAARIAMGREFPRRRPPHRPGVKR